ncbi:MAG: hypothetical protein L0228_02310 [Planctomycetes bacterium]|nr:hypothetical protein [Planctomycetota bacterium]
MSTATLEMDTIDSADEALQYRALHTGAILGLVLGVLSVFMVVAAANSLQSCLLVAPIPVLGMAISLRSLARIRREPELYTGRQLATLGLVLSLVFLIGGVSYGGYIYLTEVPEGYTRISFNTMRPDEIQERGGVKVPPEITALDGKKVFIKGYIRPDSITVSRGIDRFLLVRDNNQCCFGDISTIKYYDQIDVDMVGSRRVDYEQGVFRIGGVLHVHPENLALGPTKPVFSLEADHAN